jgi:sugar lactone lactonase YvrE
VAAQKAALGIISITRDPKGNLVFCESTTNTIRRIHADGTVQTIAGVGIPGCGGDGGPAAKALLNSPAYPNFDRAGNLYFADASNFRIRRIDAAGTITTVAGTGIPPSPGAVGPLGANGPATKAQIGRVYDLTIDAAGYVVFISDFNQLRRITPAGGIDYYPSCTACSDRFLAAAADSMGNLYTSDGSHLYRISSDGVVHNFAGFGNAANNGNGEPAIDAPPSQFIGLAADSAGNVYTEEQALSSAASSPLRNPWNRWHR